MEDADLALRAAWAEVFGVDGRACPAGEGDPSQA
jgi:hypothetical protein